MAGAARGDSKAEGGTRSSRGTVRRSHSLRQLERDDGRRLLQAGAVLDRTECNAIALKVLERIWSDGWDATSGMSHVLGRTDLRGMLDDNVQAAAAFLDAFEATGIGA